MPASLGDQQLGALVQRRKQLRLPAVEHRVDLRGFWQYFEVRERWGGADPRRYEEIVEWFRGRNDRPGTPRGAQVWLDLCRVCGQDPRPYDAIPATDPMKLTVEHYFCQAMAGDWSVLRNGLMGLYAVESGFNNSAEFKTLDSLAEQAFLGQRSYRNHCAYLSWLHTARNHELPSLAYLQSTHCTDTMLTTPIYLSSGLRASGRTRQLYLPFGAAQGLRSAVKRARVEEVVQADEPPTRDVGCGTDAPPTKRTRDAGTQTTDCTLSDDRRWFFVDNPVFYGGRPPPRTKSRRKESTTCSSSSDTSSDTEETRACINSLKEKPQTERDANESLQIEQQRLSATSYDGHLWVIKLLLEKFHPDKIKSKYSSVAELSVAFRQQLKDLDQLI